MTWARVLALVAAFVWLGTVSLPAAYTTATVVNHVTLPNGTTQLIVRFEGPGEMPSTCRVVLSDDPAVLKAAQAAIAKQDEDNTVQPLGKFGAVQVGQVVDLTGLPAPSQAETNEVAWFANCGRWKSFQGMRVALTLR